MEQFALEEDLAVRDGDDVRRNIRRNVARLRLDDRKCGQRTAAQLIRQLCRALQQSGVQVEDVAGICLASGRSADQKGQCAVSDRVLGQIIIDNQNVLALVHEILTHRASGVRSDVLQRGQLTCRCADNDRVVHCACQRQFLDQRCNGRVLLSDGDVNADNIFASLVDDGVGRNNRLTGLSVADDQLTLTLADRDHGVDCLDTGLQRLLNRLTVDDSRCRTLDRTGFGGLNRTLAVDRLTQCIDNAADQCLADRYGYNLAGALDDVAFLNALVGAQHYDGYGVLLKVLGHAVFAVAKFDELVGHTFFQTGCTCDTVADQNDRSGFALFDLCIIVLNLCLNDTADFFRT